MAILKSLIVNGVSKHLQDSYLSVIKSGTWNGSTIGVAYGGTGKTAAVGSADNPVYLASDGITACSALSVVSNDTKSITFTANSWVSSGVSVATTGTYVLQITYGNDIYAGIFTVSASGSSNSLEEINLFGNKASSSTRLYAAISAGKTIQLAVNTVPSTNPASVQLKVRRLL